MSSEKRDVDISDVPIDSLKGIGTSWYRRGVRYWCMRSVAVIFLLLMTAMVFAMAIGITIGIIQSGAPAWIVVPLVLIAGGGVSIINARGIIRRQKEQTSADDGHQLVLEKHRRSHDHLRRRRISAGAGAIGFATSALGGVGALLLILCMPVAVGTLPVALWYWLRPLAPGELRARRKVARWLTVRGREGDIPAGWELSEENSIQPSSSRHRSR